MLKTPSVLLKHLLCHLVHFVLDLLVYVALLCVPLYVPLNICPCVPLSACCWTGASICLVGVTCVLSHPPCHLVQCALGLWVYVRPSAFSHCSLPPNCCTLLRRPSRVRSACPKSSTSTR